MNEGIGSYVKITECARILCGMFQECDMEWKMASAISLVPFHIFEGAVAFYVGSTYRVSRKKKRSDHL